MKWQRGKACRRRTRAKAGSTTPIGRMSGGAVAATTRNRGRVKAKAATRPKSKQAPPVVSVDDLEEEQYIEEDSFEDVGELPEGHDMVFVTV